MRVTKYSHSCVRFERDGAVMVIDPGIWVEPEALDGVDAVLITHEHADHLNADLLADALAKRPAVRVYTNPDVVPLLDALAGAVTAVNPGDHFEAAGFAIDAYGGRHALIHPDVPTVANIGFVVEASVYHPGDSFDVPEGVQVDTVFVPVSAPWLKAAESIDFVRALAPRRAYALHDALLNDNGFGLVDGLMSRLSGAAYARVAPGTRLEV